MIGSSTREISGWPRSAKGTTTYPVLSAKKPENVPGTEVARYERETCNKRKRGDSC